MKNVLVTGKPESGKTTLLRKVAQALGERAGGFITEPIWQAGEKVGYRIVTLDGRSGILSHMTGVSLYRVGRFKVNLEDIDAVVVPSIREAAARKEFVLIDEIHKMHLFSDKFRAAVEEAFASPRRVIASLQDKPHGFIERIRGRPDVTIFEVTAQNRDTLAQQVLDLIQTPLK